MTTLLFAVLLAAAPCDPGAVDPLAELGSTLTRAEAADRLERAAALAVRSARRGYRHAAGDFDNPGTSLTADPHDPSDWKALRDRLVVENVFPARGSAKLLGDHFDDFRVPEEDRDHYVAVSVRIGEAGRFDYGVHRAIVDLRTRSVHWLGRIDRERAPRGATCFKTRAVGRASIEKAVGATPIAGSIGATRVRAEGPAPTRRDLRRLLEDLQARADFESEDPPAEWKTHGVRPSTFDRMRELLAAGVYTDERPSKDDVDRVVEWARAFAGDDGKIFVSGWVATDALTGMEAAGNSFLVRKGKTDRWLVVDVTAGVYEPFIR